MMPLAPRVAGGGGATGIRMAGRGGDDRTGHRISHPPKIKKATKPMEKKKKRRIRG